MDFFEGRLGDLIDEAAGGVFASSGFLTPQECAAAARYLKKTGVSFEFVGGYDAAERRMALILPGWCADLDDETRAETVKAEADGLIVPLLIERDSYLTAHPEDVKRPIGHRDYLGALLGLGVDRSRVGDICVFDGGAAVFVMPSTAEFLMSSERPLTQVGREKVEISRFGVPEGFDGWRRYEALNGVCASDRIDSVLSALTNLSREKIKEAISRGEAEKNYETVTKPDDSAAEGDILSLRGWGKCRISGFALTRKDRVRVAAEKYV